MASGTGILDQYFKSRNFYDGDVEHNMMRYSAARYGQYLTTGRSVSLLTPPPPPSPPRPRYRDSGAGGGRDSVLGCREGCSVAGPSRTGTLSGVWRRKHLCLLPPAMVRHHAMSARVSAARPPRPWADRPAGRVGILCLREPPRHAGATVCCIRWSVVCT